MYFLSSGVKGLKLMWPRRETLTNGDDVKFIFPRCLFDITQSTYCSLHNAGRDNLHWRQIMTSDTIIGQGVLGRGQPASRLSVGRWGRTGVWGGGPFWVLKWGMGRVVRRVTKAISLISVRRHDRATGWKSLCKLRFACAHFRVECVELKWRYLCCSGCSENIPWRAFVQFPGDGWWACWSGSVQRDRHGQSVHWNSKLNSWVGDNLEQPVADAVV